MNNIERIADAGLVDVEDRSREDVELINATLSPEEVESIVRLGVKLQGAPDASVRRLTFAF